MMDDEWYSADNDDKVPADYTVRGAAGLVTGSSDSTHAKLRIGSVLEK